MIAADTVKDITLTVEETVEGDPVSGYVVRCNGVVFYKTEDRFKAEQRQREWIMDLETNFHDARRHIVKACHL